MTNEQADPYAPLSAHIGTVRALYCEDGCGLVQTAVFSLDDKDAADALAERGWAVRPHSMGGLLAVQRRDRAVAATRVLTRQATYSDWTATEETRPTSEAEREELLAALFATPPEPEQVPASEVVAGDGEVGGR